jgi:hypothetical protein
LHFWTLGDRLSSLDDRDEYPWYWDDYHLIRRFSGAELLRAFHGPWDLDQIETLSYRPLWLLANHLRAVLLGEHLVLHRLTLLALTALFASLVAYSAHRQGLKLVYAVGASLVAVSVKANHSNLMWLTDATHALSAIPVALCCVLVARPSWVSSRLAPPAIALLSLAGLLVREDSAALFPLLVFMCLARPREALTASRRHRNRELAYVVLALTASLVVYFGLRKLFVPDASTKIHLAGGLSHAWMTFEMLGTAVSRPWRLGWDAFAGSLLVGALACALLRRGPLGWKPVAWLGCAVVACSPGLVQARSNLLMIPVAIFACALAMALQTATHVVDRRGFDAAVLVLVLALGATSVEQTEAALLSGHPKSVENIEYTASVVYGRYASRATIPGARRDTAKEFLHHFGIVSRSTYQRVIPALFRRARAKPRAPHEDGTPFLPPSPFLSH